HTFSQDPLKRLFRNKITSFSLKVKEGLYVSAMTSPISSLGFMKLKTLKMARFRPEKMMQSNLCRIGNVTSFKFTSESGVCSEGQFISFCSALSKLKNIQELEIYEE